MFALARLNSGFLSVKVERVIKGICIKHIIQFLFFLVLVSPSPLHCFVTLFLICYQGGRDHKSDINTVINRL
jgi:hypothetical protein